MATTRPYVQKVESVIKGAVVAQLGRRTLVIGPNGIGKSAIVNSIEVAGTGKVSDVAGRALLAKPADLFMLAPPGAEKVWSVAKLNDGTEAAWELSKGHLPKRRGAEIGFPLREAREALLGSPETARKWILQHGGEIQWSEVEALVPESLRRPLNSIIDGPQEPGTGTSGRLTGALETARSRVREQNANAKAQRSITPPPQPPPTDRDLEELQSIISTWKGQEGRAQAHATLESLRAQLATSRATVETLVAKAGNLERELATIPESGDSLPILAAAVLVCETMARADAKSCAICEGKTDAQALAVRAQRGRERIDLAQKQSKRRQDLAFAHRETMSDLTGARREVDRLVGVEVVASKQASVGAQELPAMDQGTAEVRLSSLFAVRAGWEASRRAEEAALNAEREAQEWDQLSDSLAKALGVLVEKARVGFEASVQRFLPNADLFGVDLLDGDREILRVGLRRLSGDHMVLHAALSGAEWARVTAALALATGKGTGAELIVPEERAFDPKTLADVLAAFDAGLEKLGDAAPQILVTSPVKPEAVPAGWAVVELSESGVTERVSHGKRSKGMTRKDAEASGNTNPVLVEYENVGGKLVEKKKNENGETKLDPIDIFA